MAVGSTVPRALYLNGDILDNTCHLQPYRPAQIDRWIDLYIDAYVHNMYTDVVVVCLLQSRDILEYAAFPCFC